MIGCGAWGTTVANVLAENGHQVMLWCHHHEIADVINKTRINLPVLPDILVHERVQASDSLELVVSGSDGIVVYLHHIVYHGRPGAAGRWR